MEIDLAHRAELDPPEAIGQLTELTAHHPFREGLWALLMTALYRAGRQADALATFRRARHHLVEQLGVEPGPRLRELESMVLDQDEQLRSSAPSGQPTGTMTFGFCEVEGYGHRGNLPVRPGRLIGREGDLDAVADALTRSAVVTVVGPGGIGKTRLAMAAAQRSDVDRGREAWLVELAAIASSSDVPRAVADSLEVTESPGRTLTQSIVATLRSRSALLMLDNCEHVIDGAAGLTHAVAERCPGARVLATSREALGGRRRTARRGIAPGPRRSGS